MYAELNLPNQKDLLILLLFDKLWGLKIPFFIVKYDTTETSAASPSHAHVLISRGQGAGGGWVGYTWWTLGSLVGTGCM